MSLLIRLLYLWLTIRLLLLLLTELLFARKCHFHLAGVYSVLNTHLHQHATEVVKETWWVQVREEVLATGPVDSICIRPLFDLKANNLFVFKFIRNKPCFFINGNVDLIAPQREVPPRSWVIGACRCTTSTIQLKLLLSYRSHLNVRLSLSHFCESLFRSRDLISVIL